MERPAAQAGALEAECRHLGGAVGKLQQIGRAVERGERPER